MVKLYKAGFTLIELLVVIAIIGVLAALVTASINDARTKARDASRVSQLKEVVTALELYHLDNDSYPSSVTAVDPGCGGVGWCLTPVAEGVLSPYISSAPADPIHDGTNSNYRYCGGGQGYAMIARWERDGATAWCHIGNFETGCGVPAIFGTIMISVIPKV